MNARLLSYNGLKMETPRLPETVTLTQVMISTH